MRDSRLLMGFQKRLATSAFRALPSGLGPRGFSMEVKMMWKDPIVEEIRDIRLNIEAECDHDFDKIFARAIEVQEKLAHRLVSKPASQFAEQVTRSL